MPSYVSLSENLWNYTQKLSKFQVEWDKLTVEQKTLIQLIFFRYRKHFPKKYYLFFCILYWLVFFKVLSLTDSRLDQETRDLLQKFFWSFILEQTSGTPKEYIESFLALPDQLKELKIVIKYTILTWGESTLSFIWDRIKYMKGIWYLLPWVSYKKMYKIEQVFQDNYFKTLYQTEYLDSVKIYSEKLKSLENWDKILVKVVNTFWHILLQKKLFWLVLIREKTLFSFYNKVLRKKWKENIDISDILGAKLLFKSEKDIKTFLVELEKVYTVIKRKDYLSQEKDSWYRWYHITFLYTFQNLLVPIELQMRTTEGERKINSWSISHFYYSLKENKWNKKFVEIWEGLEAFNYLNQQTNE